MIPLDGIYALLPSGVRRNLLLKPEEVYRISTEFGVSYRAVVVQLLAQGIITFRHAEALKKASPLAVKKVIGMGWEPLSARINVWAFGRSESGRVVLVDRGDEIHVYLPVDSVETIEWEDKVHTDLLERRGSSLVCSEAGKPFQQIVWRAVDTGVAELCYTRGKSQEQGHFELTVRVLKDLRPEKEGLYGINEEVLSGVAA
jgi:hypothetical protein